MTRLALVLSVSAVLSSAESSEAGVIFTTQSDATQTLVSPLFAAYGGSVRISAFGPQTFDIGVAAGTANVVSPFKGTDFPNPFVPGSLWSYDLYNTPASTTGTTTQNPDGSYNVTLNLLFELVLTSGPLTGLVFETRDYTNFTATNIPSVPFPIGTVFSSPEPVTIYVKFDPTGTFPAGTPVGASVARTVTVIPEPATVLVFAAVFGLCGAVARKRAKPDAPRAG